MFFYLDIFSLLAASLLLLNSQRIGIAPMAPSSSSGCFLVFFGIFSLMFISANSAAGKIELTDSVRIRRNLLDNGLGLTPQMGYDSSYCFPDL